MSLQSNATVTEYGNSHRRYQPKRPRNLRGPSSRAEIDRAWQILSMEQPKPIIPAAKVSQSHFSMKIPGQLSAEINSAQTQFATPRCYWSKAGADGRTLNLVLQDLSQTTRAVSQVEGCSPAQAVAVGAELARLHTAYWDHPDLGSAAWLLDRKRGASHSAEVQLAAAAAFRDRFGNRVASGCLDAIDHFARRAKQDILNLPVGKALIHGEPRVDNVLFEDLPSGPRAWLIDWQFATLGSPMFDLAYFLSGSLEPADRRAVEEGMIKAHQAAIAVCDPAYSLDQARREFKASLPIALHFSVGAVLAIPPGDLEDRLLSTLAERNVSALIDWDCLAS
ncbi:phosphotransferase [Novosphingobium sp. NBM11]|nr:phosphotransferase [Novosphingobium sp. NBM11]